ncbi:MAG: hypothetical protein HC875_07250 [Anaerolineales bacterium]|nr:hypothetical protein [Anaerolineales bacterium]
MDNFLLQAHSGWRWIVLALLVITVIKMLVGWLGNQKWTGLDTNLLLYSRIAIYIQVVLGLILYVLLQKWNVGMGFTGSHVIPALLAVGGVEFGAARARKSSGSKKFMFGFIGFVITFILIYGALATVGGLFA